MSAIVISSNKRYLVSDLWSNDMAAPVVNEITLKVMGRIHLYYTAGPEYRRE